MKVCEVCGQEEELEAGHENMKLQTGLLFICDNCRNDRKVHSLGEENW